MAKYLPGSQFIDRNSNILKLKGLNPEQQYRVRKADGTNEKGVVYTGNFLMKTGLSWPVEDAYESQILFVDDAD